MMIAGIDLSTHAIDVVTVPLEGVGAPVWHRFPLEGPTSFDRARRVRDAMPARTSELWDDVLAIGIEDPRGMAAGHAYRVQGGVLACLPPSVLVQPWIPSQWRKAAGMSGAASKMTVAQHARAVDYRASGVKWRLMDWPQDACDAYCVALATRAAITIEAAA